MVKSVFLSSTFSDFSKEREELMTVLPFIDVHVNCAEHTGNEGIKDKEKSIEYWIDTSDMIVVLIGNKYGSEIRPAKSFTRKEFEYALGIGKPIFAYIRLIPEELKLFTDIYPRKKANLDNFIKFVDRNIPNVPRYKLGEEIKLIAMVLRDLDRCSRRLQAEDEENSYNTGFEG